MPQKYSKNRLLKLMLVVSLLCSTAFQPAFAAGAARIPEQEEVSHVGVSTVPFLYSSREVCEVDEQEKAKMKRQALAMSETKVAWGELFVMTVCTCAVSVFIGVSVLCLVPQRPLTPDELQAWFENPLHRLP